MASGMYSDCCCLKPTFQGDFVMRLPFMCFLLKSRGLAGKELGSDIPK